MARTVADTIKAITRNHLENHNGLLFGQAITAVGWVNNTVPDCRGIVEFPMSDVSNMGIACGAADDGRHAGPRDVRKGDGERLSDRGRGRPSPDDCDSFSGFYVVELFYALQLCGQEQGDF